jgi:predicted AAA+ superfamily ATPase
MRPSKMFTRKISELIKKHGKSFPALILTGPRQSGKTTLLQNLLPHYEYINLERPDILMRVKEDPQTFITQGNPLKIIDEAQNMPELFSYIQVAIDEKKNRHYILSGSQNFSLLASVSQSLAGRSALLQLLPLTYQEFLSANKNHEKSPWWYIYNGSYPRPYHEKLDTELWYQSYITTYLERDVRGFLKVKDLLKFQLFLKLCAGRHGQQLNISNLGNEAGISQTQATHWLSFLEASYVLFRLPPYHNNFNKRLTKTPKLYFYDSAIVCQLLGIESPDHLKIHSSKGAIFEGFIITEIIKHFYNAGKKPPLYYWRDKSGLEIDLLIERGEQLDTLEIKSTATFQPNFIKPSLTFNQFCQQKKTRNYIIYSGDEDFTFKENSVYSWDKFILTYKTV